MNARIHADRSATPNLRTEEDFSLPGWTYWDPEFFELERQVVFKKSWHLVCHINDVREAGDFLTFKFLNESILTVRATIAASTTLPALRRAPRKGEGNCGHITCPYHARPIRPTVGAFRRGRYPGSTEDYGPPSRAEIWRASVRRFAPGLPSVATRWRRTRPGSRRAARGPVPPARRGCRRHVNWKTS
jgi:hypothetical protein